MDFLYKCIRVVVFPFRFLYLEWYRRRVMSQRNAYLRKAAEEARAAAKRENGETAKQRNGETAN